MSHWNYRVLRHSDGALAIHEVLYNDEDKPVDCTEEPAGFVDDDLLGLRKSLAKAIRAFDEEILEYSTISATKDFGGCTQPPDGSCQPGKTEQSVSWLTGKEPTSECNPALP